LNTCIKTNMGEPKIGSGDMKNDHLLFINNVA
jgi:hypothetical protein